MKNKSFAFGHSAGLSIHSGKHNFNVGNLDYVIELLKKRGYVIKEIGENTFEVQSNKKDK